MPKIQEKGLFPLRKSTTPAMLMLHGGIAAPVNCACAAIAPSYQEQRNRDCQTGPRMRNETRPEADPMSFANTLRATNPNLIERFSAALKATRAALQRRRVFNRTVRELEQLSSRDLNDLGIHRSMITRIALEAAYGK